MIVYQIQIMKTDGPNGPQIQKTDIYEGDINDEEMIVSMKLDDENGITIIPLTDKNSIVVCSSNEVNLQHYVNGFSDCIGMARDWDSYFKEEESVGAV